MDNYQCHITIDNRTKSHLKLLKTNIVWGVFRTGPDQDLVPMKSAPAFIATGTPSRPAGAEGTVWYQVGDDANNTIKIYWDVPTTPFTSNRVTVEASKDEVVAVQLSGFNGSGAVEVCTIKVIDAADKNTSAHAIQHIFVLMLENRSFDHMLGFSGITGIDAETGKIRPVDGLIGTESNIANSRTHTVAQSADWKMTADPHHEFDHVVTQLCGQGARYESRKYPPVNNTGFAADFATVQGASSPGDVMKCYKPSEVYALSTLAKEFAVCDKWFSSIPGPTVPNHFFAHAASSGGLDDSPSRDQILKWNTPRGGFVFENGTLFHKNLSWRIYVHDLWRNIIGGLSGVNRGDSRFRLFIKPGAGFEADVKKGDAVQYTFIEPYYGPDFPWSYRGGNSQHPDDDVKAGDQLIADVYNAIRSSPIWKSSLLIITWDEHGGFYDHVPPPPAKPPKDTPQMKDVNKKGFTFNQYGVRVPAVIISPLIARNVIDGRCHDHASIPATVEALFDLSPMTERDKSANNLTALVTLQTPRDCPPRVERPPKLTNAPALGLEQPIPVAAELEAMKHEPLDQGNGPAVLYSAMQFQIEMSPPDQKDAIVARVAGLKTVGDAAAYLDEVEQMASAAPALSR
jgi:phospholipase C